MKKKKKKLPIGIAIVLIVIVVIFTVIVARSTGESSEEPAAAVPSATEVPAADPAPAEPSDAPATPDPTESPAPAVDVLAENEHISVTFEELYEEPSISGAAYLKLAMTNKGDQEIWVYLDKGSVNDDQLSAFLSGVPTYIMPGKTSRNPFIISYSQTSIEHLDEIQSIEFDIVVAERESMSEISRISGVKILP